MGAANSHHVLLPSVRMNDLYSNFYCFFKRPCDLAACRAFPPTPVSEGCQLVAGESIRAFGDDIFMVWRWTQILAKQTMGAWKFPA